MKQKTLNVAIKPSVMTETKLTAIYDGAANCWDIVNSLEKKCHSIERIFGWYYISIKFQSTSLGQEDANEQVSGAKWTLQHRKPDKAMGDCK